MKNVEVLDIKPQGNDKDSAIAYLCLVIGGMLQVIARFAFMALSFESAKQDDLKKLFKAFIGSDSVEELHNESVKLGQEESERRNQETQDKLEWKLMTNVLRKAFKQRRTELNGAFVNSDPALIGQAVLHIRALVQETESLAGKLQPLYPSVSADILAHVKTVKEQLAQEKYTEVIWGLDSLVDDLSVWSTL